MSRSLRLVLLGIASLLIAALLSLAIASPVLQDFIEAAGVNIPTDDVITDYTWGIAWAILLLASIFAWPVSGAHKRMLAAGWLVKSFTALVVMLPYEEHYYGLDCWLYFRRAHAETSEVLQSLMLGGGDVVIAVSAFFIRIGPDSYHAVKVSFAMIGLVGLYLFYRAGEHLLGRSAPLAFWTLLLYPSVLFWSSILGKDPLVLTAIAVHVWGLANLAIYKKPRYFLAVVGGILAVSTIRIWMGPILIAPCLLVVISRIRSLGWRLTAVAAITITSITLGSATIDKLALRNASDLIEATRTVTDGWEANSSLQRDVELNSALDLVLFAPQGLFDTFFRPLPGDVTNLFGWMAGFENLGLLALSLWAALRFRFTDLNNSVFLWAVALLLTWGCAYSVVTYKDLGTAVRFKLQILPILIGLIGYLISRKHRLRTRVLSTRVNQPATVPSQGTLA